MCAHRSIASKSCTLHNIRCPTRSLWNEDASWKPPSDDLLFKTGTFFKDIMKNEDQWRCFWKSCERQHFIVKHEYLNFIYKWNNSWTSNKENAAIALLQSDAINRWIGGNFPSLGVFVFLQSSALSDALKREQRWFSVRNGRLDVPNTLKRESGMGLTCSILLDHTIWLNPICCSFARLLFVVPQRITEGTSQVQNFPILRWNVIIRFLFGTTTEEVWATGALSSLLFGCFVVVLLNLIVCRRFTICVQVSIYSLKGGEELGVLKLERISVGFDRNTRSHSPNMGDPWIFCLLSLSNADSPPFDLVQSLDDQAQSGHHQANTQYVEGSLGLGQGDVRLWSCAF